MLDFSSEEGQWLRGQPSEVAVALAARTSLRVLPFIWYDLRRRSIDDDLGVEIASICFRAATLPWLAAIRPVRSIKLFELCREGAADAFRTAPKLMSAASRSAISSIAAACAVAASALNADSKHKNVAHEIVGYDLIDAFTNATDASAEADKDAVKSDFSAIRNGMGGVELAATPLWSAAPPQSILDTWRDLKLALNSRNKNWNVWIDWYDRRLAVGRPVESDELDRIIALNRTSQKLLRNIE